MKNKVCPVCHKGFSSKGSAQMHLRDKHPGCNIPLIILPQRAVPAKPPKKRICRQCPHNPVFPTKAARKQHVKEVHRMKCPICSVPVAEQKYAKHLRTVHPQKNSGIRIPAQTTPRFPLNSAPVQLPYVAPHFWTPGGVVYPNVWPNAPPSNHEEPATINTHNIPSQRFYCQEYDCGKGFPSETHLLLHERFFHSKAAQTTEGRENNESLNRVPEIVEEPAENYSPQASTTSSSSSEEYGAPDSPDTPSPTGSPRPTNLTEGYQVSYSNVGTSMSIQNTSRGIQDTSRGIHDTSRGMEDPSTSARGEVNIPRAVNSPTALSVQRRICDAPPTVDTRPTATMCGHLFCYKCIAQQVSSNSRCPVCDDALLLYCLFKLDLPTALDI